MIDRKIVEGYFTSRSDIIRYSIRRTIEDIDKKDHKLDELANLAQDKKISIKDVKNALETAHKDTYRDMYGQD
jgi:Arc/MetJ-type ribon-helix-helix transcriptional regulator